MEIIRRAEPADLSAIACVIDAAYSHYIPIIGRTPRPMLDDHGARIARGEHYVAGSGGAISGVITIAPDKRPDALHIFNIAIDPAAQGSGLLRRLLAFAEQQARAQGLGWLTLYTNVVMARNRAIYNHLGFVELGEELASGGYQIVFMERAVTAE